MAANDERVPNLKRGVYFLANDRIFDLALAFLNSFRTHNPDLALCLIPYDSSCEQVLALAHTYRFQIVDDQALLGRCDRISRRLHGRVLGTYRKLAAWHGPYEDFIYIDTDTVLQAEVGFVFDLLREYGFVTSHSNMPEIAKWVWKPTIWKNGALSTEQISFAASTGFIASKRACLAVSVAEDKLEDAARLAEHMRLRCMEQPFLNYLMVTSGQPHTSLYALSKRSLDRRLCLEYWAGTKRGQVAGGGIHFPQYRRPPLLLHWAGQWQPRSAQRAILHVLGLFRFRDAHCVRVRWFMPYKALWRHYRFMRPPG